MSKENMTPEIRLEGFYEPWSSIKLSDTFQIIRNAFVGTATPYYVEYGNFYLQSNNVKNGKINRNNEVFINDMFYKRQKDKWLYTGDLVMVQSGHVGHSAVIPKKLNQTAAHALIIFSRNSGLTDPYFLNYQFMSPRIYDDIQKLAIGNTIRHILASDMKDFEVNLTNKVEQIEIGNLFKKIDVNIELKKKELSTLIQIKQAMLQKMFPKEGETVPEVRFEGFKEVWKFVSLKDLLQSEFKGKAQAEKLSYGHNEYLDANRLNGGKPIKVSKSKDVTRENILILWDGSKAGTVYFGFEGVLGSTLKAFVVKGNHDPAFIYHYLDGMKNNIFNNFRTPNIPHVIRDFTEKFTVPIPSVKEQSLIGNYFNKLDKNIQTRQNELEKLKQFKQAMLDKMFV